MKAFKNIDVKNKFEAYPVAIRNRLLHLRALIFQISNEISDVGEIEETLKWNQPSYLTSETKSGTTIRLDQVTTNPQSYGLFVHCQTSLIATYRELYGDVLSYDGNRCVIFHVDEEPPDEVLRRCILLALTYHLNKRRDELPF